MTSTSYNLIIDTGLQDAIGQRSNDVDRNVVSDLMDHYADYHPAVAISPYGSFEVTITVQAESARQAFSTGMALATSWLSTREPLTLTVMPTKEFDRRLQAPTERLPRLLSVTEVAERLGVSRSAVQQRIDSGSLPATKIGKTWGVPESAVS